MKLPTGVHDVVSSDGVAAERALQPGSGTTDLVAGFAARRALGPNDALIAQASVSDVLTSSDAFEPGRRLELLGRLVARAIRRSSARWCS